MLQRRPGTILQLLLAGGSYKDRKFQSGELTMIGAMPAVAVRHERRRQEKRTKRPSLLYLQSPPSRSPTPSPLQSPPSVTCSHPPPEVYVCGKVSVLHIVVVSLLLGAVLLIVGLVQLNPKADATQHRFLLLGSGAFLTILGIILGMVRCCVLPWAIRKRHHRQQKEDLENGKPRTSLDAVALDPDFHNKGSTTGSIACTAKSNTTPRSSVTSATIQPRASSATILSPSEHEALINNHRNRKDLENGKPKTSLDSVAHDHNSKKGSTTGIQKSVSTPTPHSSLTSSTIPPRPSNASVSVPTEKDALINNANTDSDAIDT